MPEQHNAPDSGGNTNTPADGGPANAPGNEPSPKSSAPALPDGFFHQDSFHKGYGKGADKGRSEGINLVLEQLGLPKDIEQARAHLESLQGEKKKPAQSVNVQDSDEYRTLAKSYRDAEAERDKLRSVVDSLQVRADQARVEKLARVALAKGVGEPQLQALVALHGDRIRMSENGELEVLSKMPDGNMVVAGETIDSFLDVVTRDNPWLLAPRQASGAGSTIGSTSAPRDKTERGYGVVETRPLKERLRKVR